MSFSSCRCSVCLKELESSSEKRKGRCYKCMNKKLDASTALTSVALVTIGAAVGFVGGMVYSWWNGDNNDNNNNNNNGKEETKQNEFLNATSYDPNEDDIGSCPICYDRRVNIALTPCGHTLCKQCTDELPTKTCPMCSENIKNQQIIYIN